MIYRFSKDIYTKEAIIKAAYRYTDKAYMHIDTDDKFYIVEINTKDSNDTISEKEFQNTLLAEMVRILVSDRTKNVRELILARAFSSTIIDNTTATEPEDLDIPIEEILTDWFEINE